MKKEYQYLAAMALFRNMYDTKQDVYVLIWNFIAIEISERGLKAFDLDEITKIVNESNDLCLPRAVVKTTLKRNPKYIEKPKKSLRDYIVKSEFANYVFPYEKEAKENEVSALKNKVLDPLKAYIERELASEETVISEDELANEFADYLADGSSRKYASHISKYLVLNEDNKDVVELISKYKEGIVIYNGICYSVDEQDLFKQWDTELSLFLDTDVIFSLMGYNGPILQNQVLELLKYVIDINRSFRKKNSKKRIELWYLDDVEYEINGYFKKAEHIIENKEDLDPSKTAMKTIVNSVRFPSEINAKKSALFVNLDQRGIKKWDKEFFTEENYVGNALDTEIYAKLLKEFHLEDDVDKHIRKLNKIMILRGGRICSFRDAKYFLVTSNSMAYYVAKAMFADEKGPWPVTSHDELINRFWFASNKGLGTNSFPSSIDIICKARSILSSIASKRVSKSYDELCKKYQSGEISKAVADREYAELRSYRFGPEDINEDIIDMPILSFSDTDLDTIFEIKKKEAKEKKIINEENQRLSDDLQNRNLENEKLKEKIELLKRKNNDLFAENRKFVGKENKKRVIRKKILIVILSIVAVLCFGIVCYCFVINNIIGSILSAVGFFATVIPPAISVVRWRKNKNVSEEKIHITGDTVGLMDENKVG